MKLTRASSYALHAMVYLAAQKQPTPVASHVVAQARGIPERFLLKVLKPLVGARLLVSVKGPNGGYRLAKSPNEISLLEVIEAVDGPIRGAVPFDGPNDNGLDRKLEAICNQGAEQVRNLLQKVRIAELVGQLKERSGRNSA